MFADPSVSHTIWASFKSPPFHLRTEETGTIPTRLVDHFCVSSGVSFLTAHFYSTYFPLLWIHLLELTPATVIRLDTSALLKRCQLLYRYLLNANKSHMNYGGHVIMRAHFFRASLPAPMFSRNDFSIWSILRNCIGMVSTTFRCWFDWRQADRWQLHCCSGANIKFFILFYFNFCRCKRTNRIKLIITVTLLLTLHRREENRVEYFLSDWSAFLHSQT